MRPCRKARLHRLRGEVRGAADRESDGLDDLLVLDAQTEGAVPVERLRRGSRGSQQGEGAALDLSRSDPAARLLLLCRAYGGGMLRERVGRPTARVAGTPDPTSGTTARMGRKLSTDFR